MRWVCLAIAAALGATAAPAHAAAPGSVDDAIQVTPAVDIPVTAALGAGLVVTEILKKDIVPGDCHWCDRDAAGNDTLNGLDRGVRSAVLWSNPGVADAMSYVTGFALAPLWAVGGDAVAASHDGRLRDAPTDSLVIVESTVVALAIDQTVKFSVLRERPFVHARSPAERARLRAPDDNLSFFSGHATAAFALAVSSGTVASLRNYRWAPLVWGIGLPLATTTAYLRMAADKHYFTDVLTGAVAGSAVGVLIPLVHSHLSSSSSSSTTGFAVSVSPATTVLKISGTW